MTWSVCSFCAAVPVLAGCALLAPGAGQPGSQVKTNLPPYTREVREFQTTVVTVFKSSDRYDKAPFSGRLVLIKQPTPPGYVKAKHPTIAFDEMQSVTEQRFFVDGKEVPYVAEPKKGQTGCWTLGKEADTGWDTNIIICTPKAGAQSIKLEAVYKGFTGITQHIPGQKSGRRLTDQERKEFLRLDESICTTTQEQMNKVLASVGLIRSSKESPMQFAVRVARWTGENIKYSANSVDNNIPSAIVNRSPGNCNQFSDLQALILRSQGVPAVISSGLVGDDRVPHVVCQFFDDVSGRWHRMPQGTEETEPAKIFGFQGDIQMLIFQKDTTYQVDSDIREFGDAGEDTGVTDQTGSGRWHIFDGGECQGGIVGTFDASRSWSKPVK